MQLIEQLNLGLSYYLPFPEAGDTWEKVDAMQPQAAFLGSRLTVPGGKIEARWLSKGLACFMQPLSKGFSP